MRQVAIYIKRVWNGTVLHVEVAEILLCFGGTTSFAEILKQHLTDWVKQKPAHYDKIEAEGLELLQEEEAELAEKGLLEKVDESLKKESEGLADDAALGLDDVEAVIEKTTTGVGESIFAHPYDPMRDVMGSGMESNLEEWNAIIADIKSKGGSINYSKSSTLAYGSSPTTGKLGEITINTDASLSALKHEYQHFLDDLASGWQGMRIIWMEPEIRYQWEINAYQVEIDMAKEMGFEDVVNQLLYNLEKERIHIFGE